MLKICKNCGQEKEHHGKGYCFNCYKKLAWQPKRIICKRCKREMPHHCKGLCPGCYNFMFHLEKTKSLNYKKYHNISLELYRKLTKKCMVCGFDKVVELHHLDENKENSSEQNLIGLCPNHHKMLHDFRFRKEMRRLLEERGYNLPEDEKIDFELEEK